MEETKQVILYRRDLKMRKGKIASQIAHASMKVFFDRGFITHHRLEIPAPPSGHIPCVVSPDPPTLIIPLTGYMLEWVNRAFAKIVLSVETEEDLLEAHRLAKEAGLPCSLITDAGRTEFHGVPTNTTVAIGPAAKSQIDEITGPEGLIPTKLA